MVITLIITVGVEVPIDNQIKTWTTETLPADWMESSIAMGSISYHEDGDKSAELYFAKHRRNKRSRKKTNHNLGGKGH